MRYWRSFSPVTSWNLRAKQACFCRWTASLLEESHSTSLTTGGYLKFSVQNVAGSGGLSRVAVKGDASVRSALEYLPELHWNTGRHSAQALHVHQIQCVRPFQCCSEALQNKCKRGTRRESSRVSALSTAIAPSVVVSHLPFAGGIPVLNAASMPAVNE